MAPRVSLFRNAGRKLAQSFDCASGFFIEM